MQTTFTNKVRNSVENLIAKFGFINVLNHKSEVNELLDKIAELQRENRNLNQMLRYYKKNYQNYKEDYKIADKLLSEVAATQTAVVEVKKPVKKTKNEFENRGLPEGYSFADYPRVETEVKGFWRTTKKSGKTTFVEGFKRQAVVKKAEATAV